MARKRGGKWRVHGPYLETLPGGRKRYRIVIVNPQGERRSVFAATEQKAKRMISAAKVEIVGEVTCEVAIDRYWRDLKRRGRRKNTYVTARERLERWLPGDRALSWVTEPWLRRKYLDRTKSLAVDSHKAELAEQKRFQRWCVARGLLRKSPAENIEPLEGERRKKGKKKLRQREAALFCMAAIVMYRKGGRGYEGALGCLLALYLGLRSWEICTLRARDVDEGPGGVVLWVAEEEGKTDNAERQLEVPGELAELLLKQAKGKKSEGYLFPAKSKTGHRGRTWLREAVKRVCKEAKVPRVCPHGLRGTHATLAREAGATGHLVAKQLGHGSVRVTEECYIAPSATEKARNKKVFKVMKGGKK